MVTSNGSPGQNIFIRGRPGTSDYRNHAPMHGAADGLESGMRCSVAKSVERDYDWLLGKIDDFRGGIKNLYLYICADQAGMSITGCCPLAKY